MTATTPALELSALLRVLSEHLHRFPHLPYVVVHRYNLQVGARGDLGEPVDAHAVLLWAKTLTNPVVTLDPVKDWTKVAVVGSINGTRVTVWDADRGDIRCWVENDAITTIPLVDLAAYVAAGTTALVASHTQEPTP